MRLWMVRCWRDFMSFRSHCLRDHIDFSGSKCIFYVRLIEYVLEVSSPIGHRLGFPSDIVAWFIAGVFVLRIVNGFDDAMAPIQFNYFFVLFFFFYFVSVHSSDLIPGLDSSIHTCTAHSEVNSFSCKRWDIIKCCLLQNWNNISKMVQMKPKVWSADGFYEKNKEPSLFVLCTGNG